MTSVPAAASPTAHLTELPIVPFVRQADLAVRRPWHYGERRLLDYLLVYIREGSMHLELDGRDLEFRAGEFCLVQPGDRHVLWADTETITPFAHFDIFYNPDRERSFPTRPGQLDLSAYAPLMQPRLETIGVRVPTRFQPRQPERFREVLTRLINVFQAEGALYRLEVQHLATELVLALCRDFGSRATLAAGTKPLAWVASYLSVHLAEPISVEDMARRAHLSPSRFAAAFREAFGSPPHRYLLHLRLEHAKELLRGSSLPVARIAAYSGFSDAQHLSRVFKRQVGVTPGAYREVSDSHDAALEE
jgi:AraC-like DNA-binding protein